MFDELLAPKNQQANAIVAHSALSARAGSAILYPRFTPGGQTGTSGNYCGPPDSKVRPQIEAEMGGDPFASQQGQALARASKLTTGRIKEQGVAFLPQTPAGTDLSPLDIYANQKLEK